MSRNRFRNILHLMIPFLGWLMTFGLSPSLDAQQVVPHLNIATMVPLSGPMAVYGKDLVNGMTLAVEDLKIKNKSLGEYLDIKAHDIRAQAAVTTEITEQLVTSRAADVFVGSVSSIMTESLIAESEKHGKPLLAPAAPDTGLSRRKGVFRTCLDHAALGGMLAQFAMESLKKRNAVVLYDAETQYSSTIAKAFVAAFTRRGGRIVETLSYNRGDGSFHSQLTVIKEKKPDVILVPGFYEEVGRIMNQAMQLGIRIPMLGADGWDSPNLINIAGKRAIRGHYFISHFSAEDPDEKVQNFVNSYQRRFKKLPTPIAAMGYDSMMVLADAFARAKTNLTDPLRRAIEGTKTVEGLLGTITFSRNLNVRKPGIILSTTGSGWRYHSRVIPTDTSASNHQGG